MSRRRTSTKRKGDDEQCAVEEIDQQTRKEDKRSKHEPAAAATASSASSSAAASSSSSTVAALLEPQADQLESTGSVAVSVPALHPIIDSTILNPLEESRVAALQSFLGDQRPLSSAKLIYRGSRDGFKAEDWWRRCGGISNLLTIVKVRGNGFVFGAFTPFQWPIALESSKPDIADPSSTTFLFSLVNDHGRAMKLRLIKKKKDRAGMFFPNAGPAFGMCDIVLMRSGKSADADGGCYLRPFSFEFDRAADGGEPIPYDDKLLQGSDHTDVSEFAAGEVEAWQM